MLVNSVTWIQWWLAQERRWLGLYSLKSASAMVARGITRIPPSTITIDEKGLLLSPTEHHCYWITFQYQGWVRLQLPRRRSTPVKPRCLSGEEPTGAISAADNYIKDDGNNSAWSPFGAPMDRRQERRRRKLYHHFVSLTHQQYGSEPQFVYNEETWCSRFGADIYRYQTWAGGWYL